MLGLNEYQTAIPLSMLTTADTLFGYETSASLGMVEGVAEKNFSAVSIHGVGLVSGGGLDLLIAGAKEALAKAAFELRADAVVRVQFVISGRELEKSVMAYGMAIKCGKKSS